MDHVKQALEAMYSATVSQEAKKEANSFLEAFQKSPEAWEISHSLLADPATPLEYRMFASQTLRSKSTYDLSQLPAESLASLKDSMLDLLSLYASKDKVVRTQLSLALCQLALQYLEWADAINDITSRLSAPENISALLEFLKSLPEELTESNKTPLTDEEFRSRTELLITRNVEHVLSLLQNVSAHDTTNNALVLDCLNSWIPECPIEDVLRIDSLASLIFKSLTQEATFEKASDCICSILRETKDIDNYELINALYQQLLQVQEFYSSHPDRLEDPELYSALTRIFVEAGESWHVLIAKNPGHFKPLVQILLGFSSYGEDLDVVKFTFYFWYQLKQMLTLPKFEESKAEYSGIYLELISVIIKHLCYPINNNSEDLFDGDREEEDKFKEFRYEMGQVLKDCCAVVGSQRALNVPFQQIQDFISQQKTQWQLLEAPLFSMRVMAKEVPLKEKKILPVIMELLVQLPEHPKIRYATTLVLGRYSEWTSKNPQFLEPQLNYIIKGFENTQEASKDIISATSQALMYFCQDCSSLLVNYLNQLFMVYQQVHGALEVRATYDLVNGLAHVIKEIPPTEQSSAAETFLSPTLSKIAELSNSNSTADDSIATALEDEAEVLTTFFSILRCSDYNAEQYPIANFFIDKVWPLVTQIISKFGKTLKVSECFCKLIKSVIHGCTYYLSPVVADIANLLKQGFESTYFGCYIWVTGVLVQCSDEFSPEINQNVIYSLAITQTSTILHMFRNNTALDIRSIPDVIEDFFNMAGELLMFFPAEVTGNVELVESLFEVGITSLNTIEEFNPLKACVNFFIDYISWGSEYPPVSFFEGDHDAIKAQVQAFMASSSHTEKLIKVVLHGLIYKFYNDVDGNDLLMKILTVSPDHAQSVQWLNKAVCELPNVGDKEVNKLIGAISVAVPHKDSRRLRISLKDFVSWYTRKNVNARASFT